MLNNKVEIRLFDQTVGVLVKDDVNVMFKYDK